MLLTSSVYLVTRVPSPFVSRDGPSPEIVFSLGSLSWPHTAVLWAASVLQHPVICHLVMFKPIFPREIISGTLHRACFVSHHFPSSSLRPLSKEAHAGKDGPKVREVPAWFLDSFQHLLGQVFLVNSKLQTPHCCPPSPSGLQVHKVNTGRVASPPSEPSSAGAQGWRVGSERGKKKAQTSS